MPCAARLQHAIVGLWQGQEAVAGHSYEPRSPVRAVGGELCELRVMCLPLTRCHALCLYGAARSSDRSSTQRENICQSESVILIVGRRTLLPLHRNQLAKFKHMAYPKLIGQQEQNRCSCIASMGVDS